MGEERPEGSVVWSTHENSPDMCYIIHIHGKTALHPNNSLHPINAMTEQLRVSEYSSREASTLSRRCSSLPSGVGSK